MGITPGRFFAILGGFLVLEGVSALGYFMPFLGPWLWGAVVFGVAALAVWRFPWALWCAVAELLVGSQGHLLWLSVGGGQVSLRVGLFVVVMLVWLVRLVWQWRALRHLWQTHRVIAWPLLLLLLWVVVSALRGGLQSFGWGTVFFDANNWLFLALLGPLLTTFRWSDRWTLGTFIAAAGVVTWGFTIGVFWLFAHSVADGLLDAVYHWIRDTGVGEITYAGNGTTNLWRVFLQSQIYSLIGLFVIGWALISHWSAFTKPVRWGGVVVSALLSWTVVLSLSRSFWVGGVGAIVVLTAWILWRRRQYAGRLLLALGCLLVIVVLAFQWMNVVAGVGSGELVGRRIRELGTDAAGSSRRAQLLPLATAIAEHPLIGSGFGRSVTYQSNDPRVRAAHPDGWYTTTAFEWGYLDTVLEMGFIGLLLLGWLVGSVAWQLWRTGQAESIGWLIALVAVLGVHMFSPYLNHPLGLGYLGLLAALGRR